MFSAHQRIEAPLATDAGRFDTLAYLGDQGYLPHPRPREAYAAMISRMDRDAGRLLGRLDSLGIADDAIVLFSSDNGTTCTGGVEASFFRSVGGLRGLKGSVHEGGIRVPMIARWPGRIAPGAVNDVPSAAWACFRPSPRRPASRRPPGIGGTSILGGLTGAGRLEPDRALYWEYHAAGGMQAVRMGRWKGVRLAVRDDPAAPAALNDLESDPGETTDVAALHPDVVARIDSVLATRTRSAVEGWNFGRRPMRLWSLHPQLHRFRAQPMPPGGSFPGS